MICRNCSRPIPSPYMRCRACRTPTLWGYLKTGIVTALVCTAIALFFWKMSQ